MVWVFLFVKLATSISNCIAITVPINDSSAPNDFNINGCDDLAIELEMDVANLTNKNTHTIDKIVDTFPNHDVLLFLSLFFFSASDFFDSSSLLSIVAGKKKT